MTSSQWHYLSTPLIFPRRLLALGMELPEDTFVKLHNFDRVGDAAGESRLQRLGDRKT